MKKVFFSILLACGVALTAQAADLREATVADWMHADKKARLATAADFVRSLVKTESEGELESKAARVDECLMGAGKNTDFQKRPANQMAVICMMNFGWDLSSQ